MSAGQLSLRDSLDDPKQTGPALIDNARPA